MSEIVNLSRAALFDHKRGGLSDTAVAALYGSTASRVATLRRRHDVPALACDLSMAGSLSQSRASPERTTKERPIGRGGGGSVATWDEPLRTSNKAEAELREFFATHPNFAADDVQVRPMRRMTASVATIVGCGASALHDA